MIAKSQEFRYERFRELSGSTLVEYMEPLVNVTEPNAKIPDDVLDRLLAELESFDEYHLVYALELGSLHSAQQFAPEIPRFLAHPKVSVRLAAYRVLQRLPGSAITAELILDVEHFLARCPEREALKDALLQLEGRIGAS